MRAKRRGRIEFFVDILYRSWIFIGGYNTRGFGTLLSTIRISVRISVLRVFQIIKAFTFTFIIHEILLKVLLLWRKWKDIWVSFFLFLPYIPCPCGKYLIMKPESKMFMFYWSLRRPVLNIFSISIENFIKKLIFPNDRWVNLILLKNIKKYLIWVGFDCH